MLAAWIGEGCIVHLGFPKWFFCWRYNNIALFGSKNGGVKNRQSLSSYTISAGIDGCYHISFPTYQFFVFKWLIRYCFCCLLAAIFRPKKRPFYHSFSLNRPKYFYSIIWYGCDKTIFFLSSHRFEQKSKTLKQRSLELSKARKKHSLNVEIMVFFPSLSCFFFVKISTEMRFFCAPSFVVEGEWRKKNFVH